MRDWLDEHPEVRTIHVAVADLNGQARGKRMPARFADKLETTARGCRCRVLNVDIWGEDIEDSPLVFETGDPTASLLPTERGFVPMPWLDAPTALLPLWMFTEDGTPLRRRSAPRAGARPGRAMPRAAGRRSWRPSWNST